MCKCNRRKKKFTNYLCHLQIHDADIIPKSMNTIRKYQFPLSDSRRFLKDVNRLSHADLAVAGHISVSDQSLPRRIYAR